MGIFLTEGCMFIWTVVISSINKKNIFSEARNRRRIFVRRKRSLHSNSSGIAKFYGKTLMCYLVLRRIYSTTIFVLINILKETCNHNHILEYSYIQYSSFLYIILHVINETCARKLVYSQDLTRMPWYLQRHWLGRCICQCNRFRPFACKTNN